MFKNEGLEFSEKGLLAVMPNFEAESINDIYAKVGEGLISGWDVMKAVYPAYKQSKLEKVVKAIKVPSFRKIKKKNAEPLKIEGLIPGMAMHFSRLLPSAAGRQNRRHRHDRAKGGGSPRGLQGAGTFCR